MTTEQAAELINYVKGCWYALLIIMINLIGIVVWGFMDRVFGRKD